jgi:hypothetical protein
MKGVRLSVTAPEGSQSAGPLAKQLTTELDPKRLQLPWCSRARYASRP